MRTIIVVYVIAAIALAPFAISDDPLVRVLTALPLWSGAWFGAEVWRLNG
jgi:hypothetical protein